MASALSLTTLQNYIDQTQTTLIGKPLLSNVSAQLFNTVTGVKNAKQLPLLNIIPYYGDGTVCAPTYSGSIAITARTLTVGSIQVGFELCLKQFEPYFTNQMLLPGAHETSYSAEQDVLNQATDQIAQDLEIAIWQASTVASGSSQLLSKFDGLIRIIENASGSYVNATGSVATSNLITGSITVTNARQLIEQNVYGAIPVAIKYRPDTAVFCGTDVFGTYIAALQLAANGAGVYAVYNKDNPSYINIVGTTMPLIPCPGLSGTNKVVAMRKSNAWKGVDLEDDTSDNVRVFFDNKTNTYNFVYDFKYGTQVAFPDQIVYAFIH